MWICGAAFRAFHRAKFGGHGSRLGLELGTLGLRRGSGLSWEGALVLEREAGEDFVEVDHEGPGEAEDDRDADEERVVACVLRDHARSSGQDNAAERALQQRVGRSAIIRVM